MIDESKLVTKDYLKKFGDKSKLLFKTNPVHVKLSGYFGNWIIVDTSINYNLGFDELHLAVLGISFDENILNKKLINSTLYLTTSTQSGIINYASGLNLGLDIIEAAVFVKTDSEDEEATSKLSIWLKLANARYINESVVDIIACKGDEVLFQTITSIDYSSLPEEPEEYKLIATDSSHKPFEDEIIGTIISLLTETTQFTIIEDQVIVSGQPVITESKTYPDTSVFSRIFSSKYADQLSHGLTFQYDWENPINSEDDPVSITNGELVTGEPIKIPIPDLFANGADSHDLWVNQVKVENGIVTDVQSGIPLAKPNQIGGMYLDGNPSVLSVNQYPVKLTSDGIGYVNVPAGDIHRYTNLDNIQLPKLGDIVLYIGSTNNKWVNGYFYQYWPSDFIASIPSGLYWNSGTTAEMVEAISTYNASINYLLRPGIIISITLKPVTLYSPTDPTQELADGTSVAITNDTLFTVTLEDYSFDLTYLEIKTHFAIELKSSYESYLYYHDHTTESNWTVPVTFDASALATKTWVLKNVLPVLSVSPVLVYRGTCTWSELQDKTATAQPGDFYTVTDKSYQEYFFTLEGTWEFMGDVFTVDGKLTIKSKNSQATETTVAEFTANQSDTTNVEFVAGTNVELVADTTGTDKKITISATDTTYTASDFDVKDLADTTSLRTTWSNKQDVITAGTGLSLASDGVTINHSNAVTAGTAAGSATKTLTFGDTFDIPTVTYDAQGHVTAKGTTTMTMPANPNTDTQADWNESNTSSAAYINNKPTIPAAQVQTDWNATTGMGVLLNKPSLSFLPLAGGTLTGQVYYNESGTVTSTVTCSRKYNWLEVDDTTTLSITMPSSLAGPCDVIYAIKNTSNSSITLNLPSTGHNMTGESSYTIAAGKIAELVFTFWSTTEVSFNGGVE